MEPYWKNFSTIMNDPDLYPADQVSYDDPRRKKFDPGVLLIGNLARISEGSRRAPGWHRATSHTLLQQLASATINNELIHRNGLVRMLLWAPESAKKHLIAFNEAQKATLNISLNMVSTITEVVGVTPLAASIPHVSDFRGPAMERLVEDRVQQSMRDLQMHPPREVLRNYFKPEKTPPSISSFDNEVRESDRDEETTKKPGGKLRRRGKPRLIEEAPPDPDKFVSPWENPLASLQQLSMYLEAAEARAEELISRPLEKKNQRLIRHKDKSQLAKDDIEFPQCAAIAHRVAWLASTSTGRRRVVPRSDLYLQVWKLEVYLQDLKDKKEISTETFESMKARIKVLGDKACALILSSTHHGTSSKAAFDHQISFFSTPPGLPRDRRSYEPLKADPKEFWPKGKMMLLDLSPKEVDFIVPDLATPHEHLSITQELLSNLLFSPASALGDAMDHIAPNMAKDLIPLMPSLNSPKKGGRFDPYNMKVSMLTEEMIRELIVAFVEWPFRPSTVALQLHNGGVEADAAAVVAGATE